MADDECQTPHLNDPNPCEICGYPGQATPDRAANTRHVVADVIGHEFAYDMGMGFVLQFADRLLAALDAEGYVVVPKDWAQEASANDNAEPGRATGNPTASGGSRPVGPSDDYLKLLRGEITAKEYVRRFIRGSWKAATR